MASLNNTFSLAKKGGNCVWDLTSFLFSICLKKKKRIRKNQNKNSKKAF